METFTLNLCILLFTISTTYASLMMVPEKAQLMVIEGDKLELQCIHQYKQGTTPESVFFMKDGERLSELSTASNLVDGLWTDTSTYTKEKASMVDSAKYQCVLQPSGTTSDIQVYVFRYSRQLCVPIWTPRITPASRVIPLDPGCIPTATYTSGMTRLAGVIRGVQIVCVQGAGVPTLEAVTLMEGEAAMNLTCDLRDIPTSKYAVSWAKSNVTLEEGSKYKQFDNILQISDPKRADMGEYECIITFFPNSDRDRHIIKPGFVAVNAPPAIDSHDNNKNMVQGDDLELKCGVSGYPLPKVKWFKDGVNVSGNQRTHFEAHGGVEGAKLKIYSLDYDDEGKYSCVATNEISPYNATAEMKLRVKDKLAALWPFLGIVAEVIILCAIILCYEKSRSKKLADEDDCPDAVDSQVDNKVRHRKPDGARES